jgi:zinc/manganese transport system substrate-binding protein
VHHKSFVYLLDWLGMVEVGSLEPKPGLPPTTAHLEALLQSAKTHPARMIIHTPYDPESASKWLSDKTKYPVVELPYTVGGNDKSSTLFDLFDNTISLLKKAIQ